MPKLYLEFNNLIKPGKLPKKILKIPNFPMWLMNLGNFNPNKWEKYP